MKSNRTILLASGAMLTVLAGAAHAQSLRCEGYLASVGDSKISILNKCGEPVYKESFCRTPPPQHNLVTGSVTINVQSCEWVDEWTYSPSSGQFMTTLRFVEGILKAIKYGDRVK